MQEHDPGRVKKSGSGRGELDRGLGWGGACDGASAWKGQGPGIGQEPERWQKLKRVQEPGRGRDKER